MRTIRVANITLRENYRIRKNELSITEGRPGIFNVNGFCGKLTREQ